MEEFGEFLIRGNPKLDYGDIFKKMLENPNT